MGGSRACQTPGIARLTAVARISWGVVVRWTRVTAGQIIVNVPKVGWLTGGPTISGSGTAAAALIVGG